MVYQIAFMGVIIREEIYTYSYYRTDRVSINKLLNRSFFLRNLHNVFFLVFFQKIFLISVLSTTGTTVPHAQAGALEVNNNEEGNDEARGNEEGDDEDDEEDDDEDNEDDNDENENLDEYYDDDEHELLRTMSARCGAKPSC